ncbi:MAG: hypothetical protein QOG64_1664 [Acidimicrobiaceae bacterium]|nr:hypothetical protein [Acidimicrobiaceae bacterium]
MVEKMMCPERYRARVRRIRAWALAHGRPVDTTALQVILLVKQERCTEAFDCWTLDGLGEFIWTDVVGWCALNDVPRPAGVAETLWSYLAFLDEVGELTASSDDVELLQRSLVAYGGLNRAGRARNGSRAGQRRRPSAAADLAPVVPIRAAFSRHATLGA